LAKQEPLLATTTAIFLLSLAGIPLTGGFFAKFKMLEAVIATGRNFWLVIFAVLMAAVSVYYYFRVIQAMYFKEGPAKIMAVSPVFKWTLVILAVMIILLGVFPNLLLNWYYF
jgi:NADH-quinone oxidoreductase subunit N